MKKNIMYAVIIVLVLTSVVVFGSKSFKKDTAQPAATTNKIAVKVQKAQMVEKTSGMTYKADLEPYQEGIISSKIPGKVLKVSFDNGAAVSQGTALITLDAQDLNNQIKSAENQQRAAENQLIASEIGMKKIETGLANAKRDYDRVKSLFDQGAVSQSELENAETVLKMAETDSESAKANIETLKINIEASKIGIESLRDSLASTVIKAPIGGIMDEKSVSLGQYVNPGVVLAKVKDVSSIYAVIQVEQENISQLKLGQKAVVSLQDSGNAVFEGTVASIDVAADPVARAFKCKIKVDNEKQLLRPGVFAKVQILSDQKLQVVAVPIEALAGNEGNYYLYINDNGIARKKTVAIGGIVKNSAEILSGVQNNDSIICTNVSILQDGDAITVVTE